MSNSQDEFSDPIEKFVQSPPQQQLQQIANSQQQQLQQQQLQQQQAQLQAQYSQQQQAQHSQQQQLQAQHSQQHQLQAQQHIPEQFQNSQQYYQEMMRREMMQNHQNIQNGQIIQSNQNIPENLNNNKETFLSKLRTFATTATLKEILVIAILFIIFTNTLFKNIIGNTIPFISVDSDGSFNTIGLLFMSLTFGVLFVLIKLLIN